MIKGLATQIFKFEDGELDQGEAVELFAELIRSGLAWRLQGSYGRTAAGFIEAEYITPEGVITDTGRRYIEGDEDV